MKVTEGRTMGGTVSVGNLVETKARDHPGGSMGLRVRGFIAWIDPDTDAIGLLTGDRSGAIGRLSTARKL